MYKGNTLSIEAYSKLNEEALLFLKSQLGGLCKSKIVVSHHAPLLGLLPDRLRNSWGTALYFNQLDDLLRTYDIHSWIYGHSHYPHDDSIIYGTKFYTNPFGYQANRQTYLSLFMYNLKSQSCNFESLCKELSCIKLYFSNLKVLFVILVDDN